MKVNTRRPRMRVAHYDWESLTLQRKSTDTLDRYYIDMNFATISFVAIKQNHWNPKEKLKWIWNGISFIKASFQGFFAIFF